MENLSLEPIEGGNERRGGEFEANRSMVDSANITVSKEEKINLGTAAAVSMVMEGIPESMMSELEKAGFTKESLREELKAQAKIFPASTSEEDVIKGLKLFVGNRLNNLEK